MKLNLFILSVTVFSIKAVELPYYEAKYKFESDEINITGIRKFNKNSETEFSPLFPKKLVIFYSRIIRNNSEFCESEMGVFYSQNSENYSEYYSRIFCPGL